MTHSNIKILSSKEKSKIVEKLKNQFGIKNVEGIFIQRGTERLFLFQGDFTKKQIQEIERTIPIERVGVYFAKLQNNEIRLSIEGTHILKNQITKNIFELNKEQFEKWIKGNELLFENDEIDEENNLFAPKAQTGGRARESRVRLNKGFVIIKYKDDFLGCGKASQEKITNFIPKSRRIRSNF